MISHYSLWGIMSKTMTDVKENPNLLGLTVTREEKNITIIT